MEISTERVAWKKVSCMHKSINLLKVLIDMKLYYEEQLWSSAEESFSRMKPDFHKNDFYNLVRQKKKDYSSLPKVHFVGLMKHFYQPRSGLVMQNCWSKIKKSYFCFFGCCCLFVWWIPIISINSITFHYFPLILHYFH